MFNIKDKENMKTHIIFGALLGTVLVFTGCKDDYQDWVKPQASAEKATSDPASHGISLAAGSKTDIVMPCRFLKRPER